jgi:hypothetical protein
MASESTRAVGQTEHHDRDAPDRDRDEDRAALASNVLRAPRHHGREERPDRRRRVEEPEHGRPSTQAIGHRREQRDRESEDHRVEVGEEHRLQGALSREEAEPVLDRFPAHLDLVIRRWRRPHARDLRHHDQERDSVEHECACGFDRREQDACGNRPEHRVKRSEARFQRERRRQDVLVEESRGPRVECRPVEGVDAGRDECEQVQRPEHRLVERGVHGHQHRHHGEDRVRGQREAAALEGIGERASDDREDEDGDELCEADQTDRERRASDLVDLERDDHHDDLVAEVRDGPADEQLPELCGDLKWRQVDQVITSASEQALGLRIVRR